MSILNENFAVFLEVPVSKVDFGQIIHIITEFPLIQSNCKQKPYG